MACCCQPVNSQLCSFWPSSSKRKARRECEDCFLASSQWRLNSKFLSMWSSQAIPTHNNNSMSGLNSGLYLMEVNVLGDCILITLSDRIEDQSCSRKASSIPRLKLFDNRSSPWWLTADTIQHWSWLTGWVHVATGLEKRDTIISQALVSREN